MCRHEGVKRGGAGKGNWGVEGEEGDALGGQASLEEDPSALPPADGEAAADGEDAGYSAYQVCSLPLAMRIVALGSAGSLTWGVCGSLLLASLQGCAALCTAVLLFGTASVCSECAPVSGHRSASRGSVLCMLVCCA